jgi:hypothetical protein
LATHIDERRSATVNCVTTILMAMLASAPASAEAEPAPPDLRLEWREPAAVIGAAGETVDVRFRLRNVGGSPAFAVVQKTHSALGPYGQPVRLQPGPKAGQTLERTVSLALATGMKELCIEVALQTVDVDDPSDPNVADNRICRAIQIVTREPE